VDGYSFRYEFRVQGVHIVAHDQGHSAGWAVARVPGEMEDRAIARDAQVRGIALRFACRDFEREPKTD